jgi:DNA-binding transcriptional MerR regulator/uncharacterized glyoxalase superfamily protein PhnB
MATENRRGIGAVADATGLTVRTLHYYEEIGLLGPTDRTPAGHRRYGQHDIERLYRIALLRRFGLSVDGVREALDADQQALSSLMAAHLATVETRLAAEQRLRTRLASLVDRLEAATGSDTDDLLDLLEDMTVLDSLLDRRIAVLVYDDIEMAVDHLTRVFGFGPGEVVRDDDGRAVHGAVHAGDGEFWLHLESPEFALRSPKHLGAATATMAVMVADVDAHHEYAVGQGADIRYPPTDQPYGFREYGAADPEGHLWSFMRPLDSPS